MELQQIRSKIDTIDGDIALLLAERLRLVRQIGHLKKQLDISIVDQNRESAVIEHIQTAVKREGLSEREITAVISIYRKIMEEAVKLESD